MKQALTIFLLNLAISLGAKRVTVTVLKDPYSQAAAEAIFTARPNWGADEAKAVAAFLNSSAGQLFSKRIRSIAAHVSIQGANDRANTIHSAGVSAGWNECVRYIHSLSRVSGERQGAAAHVDDEHGPEDEAELLERLSP